MADIYAVYVVATGALVSESSRPVGAVPSGIAVKLLASVPTYRIWNPASAVYDALPAPTRTALSRSVSARRFTLAELIELKAIGLAVATPLPTRASLAVFDDVRNAGETVDVSDPMTRTLYGLVVDLLVARGLVAAENRDTRLAALLLAEAV